jgi:hypothetical protein
MFIELFVSGTSMELKSGSIVLRYERRDRIHVIWRENEIDPFLLDAQ